MPRQKERKDLIPVSKRKEVTGGHWSWRPLLCLAASAGQRLPDGTVPFETETASLGVGVSHALPHLVSAHSTVMESAVIAWRVFEYVLINI